MGKMFTSRREKRLIGERKFKCYKTTKWKCVWDVLSARLRSRGSSRCTSVFIVLVGLRYRATAHLTSYGNRRRRRKQKALDHRSCRMPKAQPWTQQWQRPRNRHLWGCIVRYGVVALPTLGATSLDDLPEYLATPAWCYHMIVNGALRLACKKRVARGRVVKIGTSVLGIILENRLPEHLQLLRAYR